MILVLIRICAVVFGGLSFLQACGLAVWALVNEPWVLPIAAVQCLFGAWLLSAGYYGTWSGRDPRRA